MAEKELSILVRAKGVAAAVAGIGKVDKALGGLGKNFRTAGANVAKGMAVIGAASAVVLAGAVRGGIDSLVALETATTKVDGAIQQMGLTGQITSRQVADWANQIESNIGAAFDDKEITDAAATLLRFGKVTPANLRPAMEVMTDLAVKTGSVDSAADLLAKALADPAKAAGKLARQGIVLTKTQQGQIDAMVKAGKVGEAQAFILAELAKVTKGAAEASQGPYARAMSTLEDTAEDAKRALAEGLLPVIISVADKLRTKLADPKTIEAIRGIGQKLADGFRNAVAAAEKMPWGAIGDGLRTAWEFGAKLIDLFTKLPPEAQATIVALGALNKVSGGAVGGIVSELAKGLIKGVLGITAAVVNVNAASVRGGPGSPGAPTTPGAAPKGGGAVTPAIGAAAVIDMGWINKLVQDRTGTTLADKIGEVRKGTDDMKYALVSAEQRTENLLRANLYRPQPAPVVHVNVTSNFTARTAISKFDTLYRASSRTRVVAD